MTAVIDRVYQPGEILPNGWPMIDLALLLDLIAWAEGDQEAAKRRHLKGTWDQGTWGTLTLDQETEAFIEEDYGDLYSGVNFVDLPEASQKAITEAASKGVCGSSYCLAGGVVHAYGYRLLIENGDLDGDERTIDASWAVPQRRTGEVNNLGFEVWEDVPDGERVDIQEKGFELLGLDERDPNLFGGDNSVEDLKRMVNRMCHERGLPEQYPHAGAHGLT